MQGFEPMKGKTIDVVPEGDVYVMERKYDGWRVICGRPEDEVGAPWLETATGNRITSLPYIADELAELAPANTILDGELVDVGEIVATSSRSGGWNRVQHLASADAVHVPTPDSAALALVVFDVLVLMGQDVRGLPLTDRRALLVQMFGSQSNACTIRLIEQVPADTAVAEAWLDEGYEGAMFKRADGLYFSGKRASGVWCKWKPQATDDVEFTGTYDATAGSKYDGRCVGGFTFRRANGYVGRCAGMDDATKAAFMDPVVVDAYKGRIMEIAHHGETVDGALRHPQFKRWRTDKTSIEDPDRTPPAPAPAPRRASTKPVSAKGRMRNYRQMGDDKLLGCLSSLRAGTGDAYNRCVSGGSGDPNADLRVVEDLVAARGLVTA